MSSTNIDAVLNQTKGYNVSDRYNVINTSEVIQEFERFGFELTDTSIARVAKEEKQGFQKHLIRLSAPTALTGEVRTDVIVKNSYDRSSALTIMIGLFRFACSNGLIIGTNTVAPFKINHSNSNWQKDLMAFIDQYQEKIKLQQEWVDAMKEKTLDYDTIEELAFKALESRHIDARIKNVAVDPMEINLCHRIEDRGRTAWQVYNRFQENIINGSYYKTNDEGEIKKAKILTNTDEIVRVNIELSNMFTEVIAA